MQHSLRASRRRDAAAAWRAHALARRAELMHDSPSNFFDRNPALDLRRAPFEVR